MRWEFCACLMRRDSPVFWRMTWEILRMNLALARKTSPNPFSPTSNAALNCSQEWGGEGLTVWEGPKWSMGRGLGCPCFARMRWKAFRTLGRIKTNHEKGVGFFMVPRVGWKGFGYGGGSMRTSTTTSCCWGALGRGIYHIRWDFQGGNGRYRGKLTIKHRERLGLPMLPKNGVEKV